MAENQRVRLSKKMLKDSLMHLLQKEKIQKISVRDICEGAEINRTTFYKYYGSQYDLLADVENDMLTQVGALLDGYDPRTDDGSRRLFQIMSFLDENIDMCRILFNNNVDQVFPQKLVSLPSLRNRLACLVDGCEEKRMEYLFDFVVSGGFSMVKRWVNSEARETPDEMAALLNDTIEKAYSARSMDKKNKRRMHQ